MSDEKSRLSRRCFLTSLTACAAGAALLIPDAEARDKARKSYAHYQWEPKSGQHCAMCAHFLHPASCELVRGYISPSGWCRFYRGKRGKGHGGDHGGGRGGGYRGERSY